MANFTAVFDACVLYPPHFVIYYGQADVIVTNNLKDFPNAAIEKYHIDVQSPDLFLNHLFDLYPTAPH